MNELIEWIKLMIEAKEAGLTKEQVEEFIKENSNKQ